MKTTFEFRKMSVALRFKREVFKEQQFEYIRFGITMFNWDERTAPPENARYEAEETRTTGETPYWIVQRTTRWIWPLICNQDPQIFNIGCGNVNRQRNLDLIFTGKDSGVLDCLTKHPAKAVALPRRTLSSELY